MNIGPTFRYDLVRLQRNYNIKWKLSDPATNKLCCFQAKIALIK